jgi:Ca2+-binding EF-hand superfamily protein
VPGFDPPERPDEDTMDDRFADVDTNGDGSLSLSEITAATTAGAEKQFARLDTNGDGFITTAENDARQQDREKVAAAMRDCTRAQLGN